MVDDEADALVCIGQILQERRRVQKKFAGNIAMKRI